MAFSPNMYNIETNDDLAINSRLLLNSDHKSLENTLIQYNIDPTSLKDMMRTIYEWYQKEPHLPQGELHEQFVVRLLIIKKFSIEKVKEKIDMYYTVRPKMPEFLCNRDPLEPHLNRYLKTGYWLVLPRKTPDNCRVTMFRIKSSEGVSAAEVIKVICMMIDYRLRNDSATSEQLVLDYTNVTLQLALQMTPVLTSNAIFYVLKCVGANVKGIHFINFPPFAEVVLNLVKKVMQPKLVKRMHFYKHLDEVMKKFPDIEFPKDLGGTSDVSCQQITDAWEKTLCSAAWREFFIKQDFIHTDEPKRRIQMTFNTDMGLDGSFKKLNID